MISIVWRMDPRIMLLVMAIATSATAQPPPPTITCALPPSLTVSANFCNAFDEQSMVSQTESCEGFVTMEDPAPTAECCLGLNNVAYNRTACICKLTFFPAASHNTSRQRDLPKLCKVATDLCDQCPIYLTSRNGTNPVAPVSNAPYSERDLTASTIGAISLAVVFGVLLLGAMVFGVVTLIKRQRAKKNPPESCEVLPPGGAF